jgi:hypothetical protein
LSIQNKHGTAIAYIDFSKAFDTVSHNKLFSRLKSYGVGGNLLEWLRNLHSDRTHSTRVGTSVSASCKLVSGVVQGSVIGPLLFLTFINELIEIMERYGVKIKMFADDAKLYAEIVSIIDVNKLQQALNALSEWAREWQLCLSIEKCCVLNVGNISLSVNNNFHIANNVLPIVNSCRDLGVIVSSNLSPRLHINSIVLKAHQRVNMILKCFISRDIVTLQRAFTVYVRPLLEYNAVVWSPVLKCDIVSIEKVQRRFTKRLPGLQHYSYADRLKRLNIMSLELRRLHIDLIMCYKIVFGIIDLRFDDFFTVNPSFSTRGHSYKLFRRRGDVNARKHFFSIRIVTIWNSLPPDIVQFNSLSLFKKSIQHVDLSRYVMY